MKRKVVLPTAVAGCSGAGKQPTVLERLRTTYGCKTSLPRD